MKLLAIDNYDSFTFNLVQYFRELRTEVDVFRNDAISTDDIQQMAPDAIMISPGPCSPDEAGISLDVVRTFAGRIPILGVCLGPSHWTGFRSARRQGFRHAWQTSLIEYRSLGYSKASSAPLTTRYHSLVLEPDTLPSTLRVTAWCDDLGHRTVMGIAHDTLPLWGVQFHPESILTTSGHALLSNFLSMAEAA